MIQIRNVLNYLKQWNNHVDIPTDLHYLFPDILEQYHHARGMERQRSKEKGETAAEIRRLTKEKERDREKLRSKDNEIERLESSLKEINLNAASNPLQGGQDEAIEVYLLAILYKCIPFTMTYSAVSLI